MTLLQSAISSIPLLDLKGDLSDVELICVYGIGDGAVYRQIRSWLSQENHFLLFIEDDEEHFLKMKEASWAKDPKVRLFFYQDGSEELYKEIAWEFLFLKIGFHIPPTCPLKEKALEIFSKIAYYHRAVDLIGSDFQDLGVAVLHNVIANQSQLEKSYLGQSLKGMCRQIPAIICGAGASLDRQMPLLQSLQDRALIFAGGSAVTALTKQGVRPHFCAHFDPNPPSSRFLQQDAAEIPHFYQSRFSSKLLNWVHAPLLWMADGGNYPVEKWFKEGYGIDADSFDAGWTVANFCTAVAVLLGCSPIIFVGMEFSCPLDQTYAGGMQGDEHQGEFFEVESRDGKPLMTKNDWMMSAEWLGTLVQENPHLRFFNATSQGLEIAHVERCSLDEVATLFFQRQFDLSGIIHSVLQRAERAGASQGAAQEKIEELKCSYTRCDRVCDALLKLWERHYPHSPLDKGEYAASLHDLEKEVAFQMVLDPLWQIWKRPILRTSNHPLGQHLHRLLFFKRVVEANLRAIA